MVTWTSPSTGQRFEVMRLATFVCPEHGRWTENYNEQFERMPARCYLRGCRWGTCWPYLACPPLATVMWPLDEGES